MKKIYHKIILSMFLITTFSVIIPRIIYNIFESQINNSYPDARTFLFGLIITASTVLIISNVWFNFMFVKRLTHLTAATKEISQGNFNQHLEEFGKDEISQLTHHFNVMTDALNQNQYVNQSFMKDYAHEFKTPISIIKGYGELIKTSSDPEEIKHYAEIIVNESNELSKLARNILDLSMLDRDLITHMDDVFNISEQIRLIIQSMQPYWEAKQLDLDLELIDIQIKSNKELVYILLRNLIDNAMKYADDQSKLQVKVYQDSHIHIDISNQGRVIKEEELDKIFDLFYRSNEAKVQSGHGVGLSIVKKICDKLNYDIKVDSQESITTFSILIKA